MTFSALQRLRLWRGVRAVPLQRCWKSERVDNAGSPHIFAYKVDHFNTVEIVDHALSDSSELSNEGFQAKLAASLAHWREKDCRGVFIKVPTARARWMPIVVELGFTPHLATREFVMFSIWLPDTENVLPAGPSHNLAILAVVVNGKGEVLCIKERAGFYANKGWSLPQGKVEAKEGFAAGAVREVLEETGIETEFIQLCSLLETHCLPIPVYRDFSSILCVCLMRSLEHDPEVKPQESEVLDARWMAPEELRLQPLFKEGTLWRDLLDRASRAYRGASRGMALRTEPLPASAVGSVDIFEPLD